jgi:predicted RNase H-like nuclease
LIGLTNLWINRGSILTPEINRRRAVFVLGRIDEILSWEQTKEREKDVRFVELGEYLCEVRGKQYWRLEHLNSFRSMSSWRNDLWIPGERPTT